MVGRLETYEGRLWLALLLNNGVWIKSCEGQKQGTSVKRVPNYTLHVCVSYNLIGILNVWAFLMLV